MIDLFFSKIKKFDGEADLRLSEGFSTVIELKDGEITANSSKSFGFSVRVFKNGAFGFYCSNNPAHIDDAITKATKMAELTAGEIKLSEKNPLTSKTSSKIKENPLDVSLEEKIKKLKELENVTKNESITNTNLNYFEVFKTHYFFDSQGTFIEQFEPLVFSSFAVVARKGKEQYMGYESLGGLGGLELLKDSEQKAQEAVKKATDMFSAVFPPAGVFDVVVDPVMAGVFAHEALGHACEADIIKSGGSALENKLNQKIASNVVTIVDDPTVETAFGSFAVDNEGVTAKKKFLVKDGLLVSFLGSRETSDIAEGGNARAQDYSHIPAVRMSNTFFLPGKFKKEELFDIKRGIYAVGGRGGEVNTKTGEFMFTADYGYKIENGETTNILKNITLSGNIFEALNSVDAISDEKIVLTPGFCGKMNQEVRATTGGLHLRLKCMVGGVS